MSREVLERELHLIRRRLEAIEDVLAEEMTADDKQALAETLKEHGTAKAFHSSPADQGPASVEGSSVTQGGESARRNALRSATAARREDI